MTSRSSLSAWPILVVLVAINSVAAAQQAAAVAPRRQAAPKAAHEVAAEVLAFERETMPRGSHA
jgi:hypothetical protein